MRKRIIATLLASCMVFAMAACGNEEQKETMSSSESKTEVESSKTSEEVPEEKLYYNTTDYFPICEENIKITVAGQNKCPKCGADHEKGAMFCMSCGNKLG